MAAGFRGAFALLVLLVGWSATLVASAPFRPLAQARAPDVASYRMQARLDPATKTVSGQGTITYRNPSNDTLSEVWLHLYLRAFSSLDTLWMRESGREHRGATPDPQRLGDISLEQLTLDGVDLLAGAMFTDTLARVALPRPLAPGEAITIEMRWRSTLPRVFARTGYGGRDDTFFMVGQWYPKLAVYDRGRWDTEPWHANAEFFHDFGSYDVSITVPREYVVAGVGVPSGEREEPDGARTLRFTASSVTDFAFAASPDFRVRSARAGPIEVALYYLPEHESLVGEYLDTAVGALQAFGAWYGPYPHPRLTIVDVPDDAPGAGGMEYPTLITGGGAGLPAGSGGVALVTAHEVAHQWWPMQTATHEGREPWLDEGITEYAGLRYMAEARRAIGYGNVSISGQALDRFQYALATDQPATLPAWEYSGPNYASAVYSKPALGFWTLEGVVGTERLNSALAAYLAAYRFKHPTGADVRASLERSLGDLSWFFDDYMAGRGTIDYAAGRVEDTRGGSNVWVLREGAVRVPVDVRVTLASGAQETRRWDGRSNITSYTFAAGDPVVSVEVDPHRRLAAELDILDNGVATRAQTGPALTLAGRLAFWAQAIVQLIGLFG